MKKYTSGGIAARIWMLTAMIFTVGFVFIISIQGYNNSIIDESPFILMATVAGSLPAFLVLVFSLDFFKSKKKQWQVKIRFMILVQLLITLCYGGIAAWIGLGSFHGFVMKMLAAAAVLFACSVSASLIILKKIAAYLSFNKTTDFRYSAILFSLFQHKKNNTTMETFDPSEQLHHEPVTRSNKLLSKGVITGVLILVLLIPTIFISNLVDERANRQKEVVKEVSSKWASSQTVSAPYLVIPYNIIPGEAGSIAMPYRAPVIILANELLVDGRLMAEQRPRSIYKVLLYKSGIHISGNFKPVWPAELAASGLDFSKARLCLGISDFKGIESQVNVSVDKQKLLFSPAVGLNDFNMPGLSVPVNLNEAQITGGVSFDLQLQIKGSEQLHFVPLAANSKFQISSAWPSPSFDGNTLPNERVVNDKGFSASWIFNQANLPFGTVLNHGLNDTANLSFGVSLAQPGDQYSKTTRSVKYAILFIGLTFALFFIVEIFQHKPLHPVQYILVGLALVIFYSLLLSISEYILFDEAYLVAALATVLLITLYAKGHFGTWKIASIFFGTLATLYTFIFILISLEDTALLVGSIGLFAVLALVMYASRRINWYSNVD